MAVTVPTASLGISTGPQQVTYEEVLRVWLEADRLPQIEHAWLFDHLMPIRGDISGPIFESWTLLSALAAMTERLRIGVLVTSNRFRPPAVLARIAVTVDHVSGGRLDLGLGAGSRPSLSWAQREYEAHGLPYADAAHATGSLAEACTIIRKLWTEAEPFDFDGTYHHLTGAWANPKPVQQPYPPIVVAGSSSGVLRIAAEHADIWNIAGIDLAGAVSRSRLLDTYCVAVGRDPSSLTRSILLPVSYDQPGLTRDAIGAALDAGFGHVVLSLGSPFPVGVASWVATELIDGFVDRPAPGGG